MDTTGPPDDVRLKALAVEERRPLYIERVRVHGLRGQLAWFFGLVMEAGGGLISLTGFEPAGYPPFFSIFDVVPWVLGMSPPNQV